MTTGTYAPETDRGKVRMMIGDDNPDDVTLSDATIDALLVQNSDSVWYAAADGCRVMAAKKVNSAFAINIAGALNLDKSKIADTWMALARHYEERAGGSSDNIREYVDSFSTGTDEFGLDTSEYVGEY